MRCFSDLVSIFTIIFTANCIAISNSKPFFICMAIMDFTLCSSPSHTTDGSFLTGGKLLDTVKPCYTELVKEQIAFIWLEKTKIIADRGQMPTL